MISCRDQSCRRRTECACYQATGYPSGAGMVGWAPAAQGCPHFEPLSIRRDKDIDLCPVCLGKGEVLTPTGASHWCGMCAGAGDMDD